MFGIQNVLSYDPNLAVLVWTYFCLLSSFLQKIFSFCLSSLKFFVQLVEEVFTEKKPKIVNGYLFGDTIGEGSYSKVKEVLEVTTLVRRAVKIIKAARLRKIPNGRVSLLQMLGFLSSFIIIQPFYITHFTLKF